MSDLTSAAVLNQVFGPLTQCLTPEVAQRLVALRASAQVQRRLDELANKSSEGMLSAEERSEYETWVRALNFIGVLQAKALHVVAANGRS